MFGLLVLLCSPTMCMTATPGVIYETVQDCHTHAGLIKQQGLSMIDRGELEPHTFNYQCVAYGSPI